MRGGFARIALAAGGVRPSIWVSRESSGLEARALLQVGYGIALQTLEDFAQLVAEGGPFPTSSSEGLTTSRVGR